MENPEFLSAYGFSNMVLVFFLFIHEAWHIPAATDGSRIKLEIALSPLWARLFFNEVVDRMTFIGLVVAGAIARHLMASLACSPGDVSGSVGLSANQNG